VEGVVCNLNFVILSKVCLSWYGLFLAPQVNLTKGRHSTTNHQLATRSHIAILLHILVEFAGHLCSSALERRTKEDGVHVSVLSHVSFGEGCGNSNKNTHR